jgi:hypothetical protein
MQHASQRHQNQRERTITANMYPLECQTRPTGKCLVLHVLIVAAMYNSLVYAIQYLLIHATASNPSSPPFAPMRPVPIQTGLPWLPLINKLNAPKTKTKTKSKVPNANATNAMPYQAMQHVHAIPVHVPSYRPRCGGFLSQLAISFPAFMYITGVLRDNIVIVAIIAALNLCTTPLPCP